VLRLLPKGAQQQIERQEGEPVKVRHVTAKQWITLEAQRLKRMDLIPPGMTKTKFAKLLAANMDFANQYDISIQIRPVKWPHIKNNLENWGLWPISAIQ